MGKLLDIDLGNVFLDLNPKAKTPKSKTNEWNYIKLKSFCTAENKQFLKSQTNKQKKKPTNKLKRQSMEWEKVFANHISDKKLIFKIYELFYSVMRRKGNIATCNNMRTLKAKGNKSGRERLILHDITYKWNISITMIISII